MKIVFKGIVAKLEADPAGTVGVTLRPTGDSEATESGQTVPIDALVRMSVPRKEDGSDPVRTGQAVTITFDFGA
jgi:hypothetical protein